MWEVGRMRASACLPRRRRCGGARAAARWSAVSAEVWGRIGSDRTHAGRGGRVGQRCGKWYAGGRQHGILAGGGAASGAHAQGAVGGGAGSPTVLGLGRVCKVAR